MVGESAANHSERFRPQREPSERKIRKSGWLRRPHSAGMCPVKCFLLRAHRRYRFWWLGGPWSVRQRSVDGEQAKTGAVLDWQPISRPATWQAQVLQVHSQACYSVAASTGEHWAGGRAMRRSDWLEFPATTTVGASGTRNRRVPAVSHLRLPLFFSPLPWLDMRRRTFHTSCAMNTSFGDMWSPRAMLVLDGF